jgi:subtilisin family serine protease
MTPSHTVRQLAKLAVILAPLGVGSHLALQGAMGPAPSVLDTNPHVADELIVQFRLGTSPESKASVLARFDAIPVDTILAEGGLINTKGDLELVKIPAGTTLEDAIRGLQRDPSVEFAEPNWIVNHFATSNDTYYTNGNLWGMYGDQTSPANQYGSQAGEAWAAGHTGSASVYVGTIDEGVMFSHTDLNGQVWTNPADPQDGVDNDGNGYIDDIHGWDFNDNNNSVYDGKSDDHGTHVAGTIGAKGGNGTGVAGVNWNVTIVVTKFLGSSGGTIANAVKACDYHTTLKIRQGVNMVATNNSWGGGGYSQAMYDAIQRANVQNILFCAAAGNGGTDGVGDNNDTTPNYPSNYSNANVIAVASITSSGAKSSFSNYGATTVDIGAPGSSIVSTVPSSSGSGSSYASYSGTSMATPHVTGACALYASTHPGASAATIKAAILNSAVATASLAGKCVTGGRLNVSGF